MEASGEIHQLIAAGPNVASASPLSAASIHRPAVFSVPPARMVHPITPSPSASEMRPGGAPPFLARLLLPAAACLLGVLIGAAWPPAGGGPRDAASVGDGRGGGDTKPTTTTITAGGGIAHLRPPRSAVALAAVFAARRLGGGDPRLERVLLTAGSLPHMSAGVEVVAAAASIPPHAH